MLLDNTYSDVIFLITEITFKVIMARKWLMPLIPIMFTFFMNAVRSDDFLTPFQSEIDQIPKDLDTLIIRIEQNYSPELTEPSSSIQPIQLCVPSQEEYLEFWSIVNNFDDENDNPDITITQSPTCSENDELDKLKVWILQLKNNFYELLKEVVWSDKYVQLKIDYENMLSRFVKHIDVVDKKVTAKGKDVMSKLRTEYKVEENKIRTFFRKLQDKKKAENEKNAKLCIAEVMADRIDNAVKIFNSISEERQLRSIATGAYKNEDSFQRVFDFIERLDTPGVIYGYQGLMIGIASKGHWKSLNLLIFLNAVEKLPGSDYSTLANSLQIKLKPMFQTGDYKDVYSAINTRISGSTDFGQTIMPSFIRGVYNSDVNNVIKILDMRSNFYYMRHKLYLVDALITEMKIQEHTNKPEFFIVLSDLIDMKSEVFKQSNENDKKIVNSMFENLPDSLLPLMHPKLCIQNSNNNEFMHAAATVVKGVRQITTSLSNEMDDTFYFDVEFLKRGRSILLKNSRFGEYLYLLDGVAPRKLVSKKGAFKEDNRAHFTIEGMDSFNVRIKNEKFNEFLFSPNEGDRFVQSKSQVSEDGLWKLSTCR